MFLGTGTGAHTLSVSVNNKIYYAKFCGFYGPVVQPASPEETAILIFMGNSEHTNIKLRENGKIS